ncbi:hypothetical protein BJB15x_010520 [Bartonella sp. JB15]|nr:hypothetical protein BJB15x_010520 [Bartonella sp. JB15]
MNHQEIWLQKSLKNTLIKIFFMSYPEIVFDFALFDVLNWRVTAERAFLGVVFFFHLYIFYYCFVFVDSFVS